MRERPAGRLGASALLAAALLLPGSGGAMARTLVQDIAMPDGHRQRVVEAQPEGAPRATLVMLPGGTGELDIDAEGRIAHGRNVLVRTLGLWGARGFAVLIPDALDGRNLRGLRSSNLYGDVVMRLVAFARSQAPVPVVLVGTSQGSIAAMNGAARLGARIAGVVLTESVSRPGHDSRETVFDATPARVTAPALIVANRDDTCPVAPPDDAPAIAQAMTATRAEVLTVQGGDAGDRPCGSLSAHGYAGIETAVVDRITAWIDRHL